MRRLPNGTWVAIVLGGAIALTVIWAYFANGPSLRDTLKETPTPAATGMAPPRG